ncbi:MAG: ribonuclease H-like domain-containing protein [Bacteroides sp.]
MITVNDAYDINSEAFSDISESTLALLSPDTVIFDIETTGFSAKSTHIYLIGAVYAKDGQIILKQWFARNSSSEAAVISSFFEFLKDFSKVLGYNILGFDIPYLLAKCTNYNLSYNFDKMECIDLFREVKQISNLLKLPDLKQKSIEAFLGIARKDRYSGGELIKVYENYKKSPDDEALRLLLLHNADDIRGLIKILPMRSYQQIVHGDYTSGTIELNCTDDTTQEAIFSLNLGQPVPARVSCGFGAFYMTCYKNVLKICCRIYSGELKYFYPDYKDYYYLPVEDRAIHKSVAAYVDKAFRTKAKACNCYSKKTGIFLPQKEEVISPYFKTDYYDKTLYFELTDDFKKDTESQLMYISHIIRLILGS